MIDHPFLSFKGLSEDELIERTSEIHKRLSKAHMWGSSPDLISQLEWMLEMIEEERQERLKVQAFEAMQGMFPEVVESDPEFASTRKDTDDSTAKIVKPAQRKTADLALPDFDKKYVGKDGK